METQTTSNNQFKQLTAIDRALAAAKARKAAKDSSNDSSAGKQDFTSIAKLDTESTQTPPRTPRADTAAREAKQAQLKQEREERRQAREAKKAERASQRETDLSTRKNNAHMKKVETAKLRLPIMDAPSETAYNELINKLTDQQLCTLAEHLRFKARLTSTKSAPTTALAVGTRVRITNGEGRYIGLVGTVTKSQRLRSFVSVPKYRRDAYVFTSDLEVVTE